MNFSLYAVAALLAGASLADAAVVSAPTASSAWASPFASAAPYQVGLAGTLIARSGSDVGLKGSLASSQVLGAMTRYLPQGFYDRLGAAVKSPQIWESEGVLLARQFAAAQQDAAGSVRKAVAARQRDIAVSVVRDQMTVEELDAAAAELKPFSFYGLSVAREIEAVDELARTRRREQVTANAYWMALQLLSKNSPGAIEEAMGDDLHLLERDAPGVLAAEQWKELLRQFQALDAARASAMSASLAKAEVLPVAAVKPQRIDRPVSSMPAPEKAPWWKRAFDRLFSQQQP